MNNVGAYAANVSVANGEAQLRLASSTSGALIHTGGGYKSGQPTRYALPVGGVTEARVLRRFWGQGYATEASWAVLDRARSSGFERLWASVWDWNAASRRVLAKAG